MTVDSITPPAAPDVSFSPLAIECFSRLARSLFERKSEDSSIWGYLRTLEYHASSL